MPTQHTKQVRGHTAALAPCSLPKPRTLSAHTARAGWLLRLAVFAALSAIALLFIMVVLFALPLFTGTAEGSSGVFSWQWLPASGQFGILPMLCATLLLAFSAILLAMPLAFGICAHFYLGQQGSQPSLFTRLLRATVNGMTAIPTVVYGFTALFLLTPLVRAGLGGTGLCWLSAMLVLALLALPTMVLVMEASLRPRMQALRPTAPALGFSPVQTLLFLGLPAAREGVLSAAVLGFGRAAGDTLLPLMLSGNAPQLALDFSASLRTLSAHMALVTANEAGSTAYNSLFAAGALLLLVNAGISLMARALSQRTNPNPEHAQPKSNALPQGILCCMGHWGSTCLCGLTRLLSWLAPLVVLGALGALLIFLCLNSVDALNWGLLFGSTPPLQALLGLRPVWDGIWPACLGTGCLVLCSMALAVLPGIGCGIYLAEYATAGQRRWIGCAAEMLAGTPSIVMGLFGFLVILFLRRTLLPEANTCLLLAAACLALLVLPVLIIATREALEACPHSLRMASAALGFSRQQTLRHVLLPAASRGIASGMVLAIGRAAEDTAVIMLTGVVANAGLPAGLLAKFEALPFFIYYTAAEYQTDMELARGFGAALLLLAVALVLLLLASFMRRRYSIRRR